jgi:outer membrane protein assembly factor BamB
MSPGKMKTKFTTAVLYDGFVYGLDDGILACLDIKTGKQIWKGGRYQHGQILLAGDLLIVQGEEGDVYLVKPDPKKLLELGKIPALSSKTWNNPALAGRMLLVRNDREAACYELPARDK